MQKCIRTPDIDEVGKTSRHGTFFQMNGNFSFGDYFKEGAIDLAWKLITNAGRRRAASGSTRSGSGRPSTSTTTRRSRSGAGWPGCRWSGSCAAARRTTSGRWASPARPAPARRSTTTAARRTGREGGPEVDEDRYLEFWNLVFMQYEIADVKTKEDFRIVSELPAKNIDTGMGLERIASLLQGVDNLYEIDEVGPILDQGGAS